MGLGRRNVPSRLELTEICAISTEPTKQMGGRNVGGGQPVGISNRLPNFSLFVEVDPCLGRFFEVAISHAVRLGP